MLTDVQVSWLTLLRLPTCTVRVPIFDNCQTDLFLIIPKRADLFLIIAVIHTQAL